MPQEYTHYGTLRGFVSLEMADFNKSIFAQTAHTEASSRSVLQYLFVVSSLLPSAVIDVLNYSLGPVVILQTTSYKIYPLLAI